MGTTIDTDTLAPGTCLGPYEVAALIGAGGMGRVYRARDPRLGRDVALKVVRPDPSADSHARIRFVAEARAAGALNHPNVLAVYDVGFESEVPYIVSELLEGSTLRQQLVDRGRPPLRTALDIARQACRGLAAAHDAGIVHRDVKPENLFVTRDGRVKVVDFGLAKLARPAGGGDSVTTPLLTDAATVMGTVGYMSPEQVRGEPIDSRSDIFSLGVVIHEMLSGRHPFRGATVPETQTAILREDPPELPADVPAPLRSILKRCLEKVPAQRFHSAHDLDLALEAAGDHGASAPVPAAKRRPRRLRALVITAAAVALAAAAVAVDRLLDARSGHAAVPSYHRLTFRRGLIRSARFSADGHTILYAAAWDGGHARVYSVRPESPESRALELPDAAVLAVSKRGELALALGAHTDGVITYGTLARVPLAGGAPRPMIEHVKFADWSPSDELAIVRRVDGGDRLEFPVGRVLVQGSGSGIAGLAFPRVSPDGSRVAFIEYAGAMRGRVSLVDRTGARTPLTPDYVNIFGLAWRGDEVWYTAADDRPLFRALYAVRPGGAPRLIARVPGNVSLHDISEQGRVLVAHTDDRHGFAVVLDGERVQRDLSWLDASAPADISPDGQFVLFTETGQGGGAAFSVYLRRTDGSPAVRLGEGRAIALSPDAKWALVVTGPSPVTHFDVVPTGAGDTRRIAQPGFEYSSARWLSDGRIVVHARERGRPPRLYLLDSVEAAARPLTPEGTVSWAVAPDGRTVAVTAGSTMTVYTIGAGDPRDVPLAGSDVRLLGWTRQGLLGARTGGTPYALSRVFRIDLNSGREELWRQITPAEPAGLMYLANFHVTPDGRSHTYSWHRALSDLYLIDGLE